jgi:hypothetical protein
VTFGVDHSECLSTPVVAADPKSVRADDACDLAVTAAVSGIAAAASSGATRSRRELPHELLLSMDEVPVHYGLAA